MITIKHIDTTETVFPNREKSAVITKAEQSKQLMSDDVLNVEIISAESIDFRIGDYIEAFGQTYTLNQLPTDKKANARSFNYSLTFESEMYELLDGAWLLPENTYGDAFVGNLKDFLDILIENLERGDTVWELGTYPSETDNVYKTLSFPNSNCLQVLQSLCKEWEVEFEYVRENAKRILNIKTSVGSAFAFPFKYGRIGGAYSLERKTNTNKNVVTRLYAFGSADNLPSGYRSTKLCLPNKNRNQSYIENADYVAVYGHRENVRNFDTIKPERKGNITTVNSVVSFSDSSMDFDLNETDGNGNTKWLIAGVNAKIEFLTGNLAGYSFEITAYNHTNKQFHLKQFHDENGLVFPNPDSAAFQIAVGDEYFISGIRVPDSYVTAAENKLNAEAQKYYNEYCKPHVDYSLELNPLYLKKIVNAGTSVVNVFAPGDTIRIIDEDLGVDEEIRINSFTRDLLDPYSYKITLSDNVQFTTLQRVLGDLNELKAVVKMNDLTNAAKARRNWLTMQDVLDSVFDTEGQYYSEKIKPLSIETTMLAVGAKSQQFVLRDVIFNPNYAGNAAVLNVSNGYLDHYTINDSGVKTWTLTGTTFSSLSSDTAYYIYAKCAKGGTTGTFTCETTKREFNADPVYYYFLIGTLSSAIDGARALSLTYGFSTINGQFIKSGRIESNSGDTYIDLTTGIIQGVFNFLNGLISGSVAIGTSAENAICGLGGGEYLIWAGKTGSGNPRFSVTEEGIVTVYSNVSGHENEIIFEIIPGGDGVAAKTALKNLICENAQITGLSLINGKALSIRNGNVELGNGNLIVSGKATIGKMIHRGVTLIKNGNYAKFMGIVPCLLSSAEVVYSNGAYTISYNHNAYREDYPNLSFAFGTPTRLGTGRVKIPFDWWFSNSQNYFVVLNGVDSNNNFYISVEEKAAEYITVRIADDSSPNDAGFHLQLFALTNYQDE